MNRFVLDASVAIAWVTGAAVDPYATAVQSYVARGWRAIVPALWQLEVANALLMNERRKTLTSAEADRSLRDLEIFLASLADLDATPAAMRELRDAARMYQLMVYDAAYLELAKRESLPIATLDKGLRAAAVKAGVALLK